MNICLKNNKDSAETTGFGSSTRVSHSFDSEHRRYIRYPDLKKMIGGCSRSTLWRWIRNGSFPKSYELGPNVRGWYLPEILAWIDEKSGNQ